YFQAPGLRLFFIVPQEWTNAVLPIQISGTSEIRRAMVGRIEVVTPRQRELLKEIAAAPVPNLKEVIQETYKLRGKDVEKYNAMASGRKDGSDLRVAVPAVYQKYLELGRFRVSLLMNAGRGGDK